VPFVLASLFVRLAFSVPQREIVTVTTNVPGPQEPLYALGRRLVEIIPYVPIATTLRTGVAIFTYCGQVTFGVTGDYATTPDLDVLARGIEDGVAELLAVVRGRGSKRPASRQRKLKPPKAPKPTSAGTPAKARIR
jgi:WS/DGAT C-terminal domain